MDPTRAATIRFLILRGLRGLEHEEAEYVSAEEWQKRTEKGIHDR